MIFKEAIERMKKHRVKFMVEKIGNWSTGQGRKARCFFPDTCVARNMHNARMRGPKKPRA